jgi:hypothetical protein
MTALLPRPVSGNKFMQMFDDYDEAAATTTATREFSNGEEGGASDSDDNETADQTRCEPCISFSKAVYHTS